MLGKILETLYTKVFINIIVNDTKSIVYVEVISKGEILSTESEVFQTNVLNPNMHTYLKSCISQSPYYYISILDKSLKQGALPTCSQAKKYVDTNGLNTICVDKKWSFYTSQEGIKDLKYEYQSVGLDLIFSPFSILNRFFKDKISSTLSIFALIQEKNISLCVFNQGTLLYAQYINMKNPMSDDKLMMDTILEDDDEDEISLDIDGITLDDLDADEDISLLDDFWDIEDLDTHVDIEEFSEAQEESTIDEKQEHASDDDFNDDYEKFIKIQDSINDFYHDEKYESEFVESIFIADAFGVSTDLKKYLEEEMFLNVVIRKISLEEELSDMAKAEIL